MYTPDSSSGQTSGADYSHRHATSSAFSTSANPNEDWTKISDLAERRRIQNRIAQRNYRKKLRKRLEDLERRAVSSRYDKAFNQFVSSVPPTQDRALGACRPDTEHTRTRWELSNGTEQMNGRSEQYFSELQNGHGGASDVLAYHKAFGDAYIDSRESLDVPWGNQRPSNRSEFSAGYERKRAATQVAESLQANTSPPDEDTDYLLHPVSNPFAFSPQQLSKMYNPKSLGAFYDFSPLTGLGQSSRTLRDLATIRPRGSLPHVPGLLNGTAVSPLGDLGASHNYVSEEYAENHDYTIDTSGAGTTKLPNGSLATVIGSVKLDFQFQNESRKYSTVFKVLRNCAHDVILGKGFLAMTRTFKNFIKERILWKAPCFSRSVMYLGSSDQWLNGSLNGQLAYTLADSWSNVTLVSERYATEHRLIIERGPEHRVRLQMGDKTVVRACGIVRNVEFAYEQDGTPYSCDLYVLRDLPCDVLLSCDFLCETNAFDTYYELIFDKSASDEAESYEATLNAIVNLDERIQRLKSKRKNLFGSSTAGTTNGTNQLGEVTLAKQKQQLLQRMSEVKKLQDKTQQELKLAEIRAELRQFEASVLQSMVNPPNASAGSGASGAVHNPPSSGTTNAVQSP